MNADWRGNIRELENFIERCVILTQGDELNVPRAELNRSRAARSLRLHRLSSKQSGRRSWMR